MSYLNCAPIYHFLDKTIRDTRSALKLNVISATPAKLTELMLEGKVDAGPMPVMDYLRYQDKFELMGGLSISSRKEAGSVLLFSQRKPEMLDGLNVALSPESSTSNALLRIILENKFNVHPHFKPFEPDTPDHGKEPDARLVIGDRALRMASARPEEAAMDLGKVWSSWQELPTVFALFVARKGLAYRVELTQALRSSRNMGLSRLEEVAQVQSSLLGFTQNRCHLYLSSLDYGLEEVHILSIRKFEDHARELGLLG